MGIELPTVPAGILVLLALAVPYVQAIIQRPTWKPRTKKLLAIVLALLLTAVVLVFYYLYTRDTVPDWPAMVLLALVVAQTSYAMVTKTSAGVLEKSTSPPTRRDVGPGD